MLTSIEKMKRRYTGDPLQAQKWEPMLQIRQKSRHEIPQTKESLCRFKPTSDEIKKLKNEIHKHKGYVYYCQKVGHATTYFGDKMSLETVKGCQ